MRNWYKSIGDYRIKGYKNGHGEPIFRIQVKGLLKWSPVTGDGTVDWHYGTFYEAMCLEDAELKLEHIIHRNKNMERIAI